MFRAPAISRPQSVRIIASAPDWCHLYGGHENCQGARLCAVFDSLSSGRFEGNFIEVNFKLMLMIDGLGIFVEIDFRLILLDLTNEKSTLVQVMAWCGQATSHYLSQCWPRSMSPNGVSRPQWVNNGISLAYSPYQDLLNNAISVMEQIGMIFNEIFYLMTVCLSEGSNNGNASRDESVDTGDGPVYQGWIY